MHCHFPSRHALCRPALISTPGPSPTKRLLAIAVFCSILATLFLFITATAKAEQKGQEAGICLLLTHWRNLTPSQSVPYGTPSVDLSGRICNNFNTGYCPLGQVFVTITGTWQSTDLRNNGWFGPLTYRTDSASVGTYVIDYEYRGNGLFCPASDTSTTLTVTPAIPFIAITPYALKYDGKSHTATGTATCNGRNVSANLDLTGTTHTNPGDYPADRWSFHDPAGNCADASGTVHDIIYDSINILLVPGAGPPTSTVLVSGSGFDPFAAIDIYFDTTDLVLTVSDDKGNFGKGPASGGGGSGIPVQVPKDAVPGTHWVTAVERTGIRAAQAPFLVRADWAQFRFGTDHTGFNPYEVLLGPDTVGWLYLNWFTGLGIGGSSSVAVVNGVLYAGSGDGWWYAFDAATGKNIWEVALQAPSTCSGTAVVNGMVYAQEAMGGPVFALNAANGALVWKGPNSGNCSTPAVAKGLVFVGSEEGKLYALNARTGATVWTYPAGGDVSPVVANGIVYFGASDGKLYAVTAGTGILLWSFPASGDVAVSNGVVYVGADRLYALSASTGTLLWSSAYSGSPSVGNGVVYLAGDNLYAIDIKSRTLLWEYAQAWTYSTAIANGVVYFTSADRNLYALDATTGSVLWKYGSPYYLQSSPPVVVNGYVYFTWGGWVQAFDLYGDLAPNRFHPPERPDPHSLSPDYGLVPKGGGDKFTPPEMPVPKLLTH